MRDRQEPTRLVLACAAMQDPPLVPPVVVGGVVRCGPGPEGNLSREDVSDPPAVLGTEPVALGSFLSPRAQSASSAKSQQLLGDKQS